jgi:hypothetical protein
MDVMGRHRLDLTAAELADRKDRNRVYMRNYMRTYGRTVRYTPKAVRPSPAAIAEAKRAHALGHQSTVAALMGDPLPGRSALDRRSQAK